MKPLKYLLIIITLLLFACDAPKAWQEKPLIVLTFDDCHSSIYDVAFPLLQEYGFYGTNIVCSCRPGFRAYYTWQQLHEMTDAGWEVAGHTSHHVNLSEIPLEEAEREISLDLDSLRAMGFDPQGFALPSGKVSKAVFEILKHYYSDIRNSQDTINYFPVDPSTVGYYMVQTEYSSAEPIRRMQLAGYRGECLLILGFHRFLGEDEAWVDNCQPQEFREILEYISQQGYRVLTMHEALSCCR
ncbi:MAG: polysaccharide deacetylase family protein [Candidatus Cloacimonetes bacterium]|nr:polysaccharide deacetylase family protein [Candidatus Cloacimonadota bacterium]